MIEIAYYAAIFLSAFSLGKKILERFKLQMGFIELAVLSSALGFGAFSYATLALGVLGLLYKSILWILILLSLLFSKNEILYFFDGFWKTLGKIRKLKAVNLALAAILCIFILANLVASLSSPYLWDEVTYNIALPKIYAIHHKIIPVYDEFRSNYPFNINMLFTLGIIISNASLSKLFMFGYGTLLALAIFAFARQYFSLRSALLAALIYYTMPMVSNHISSAYTDMGVAFYIFLAYYAFYKWAGAGKSKANWFYLSAIMAGLSIASKHTALYYLPPLFLIMLYRLFFMEKQKLHSIITKTSLYLLIVLLLVSPWLIKSYVHTGNPIFPFGYQIFGGKFWDLEKSQNLIAFNFLESVGERTIPNFLAKFWDLTMNSPKYGMLLGFGPVFLAFAPLIFLFRKVDSVLKHLLIYSAISLSIWFFGPQVLRYLMIYPMLSIVSGEAADKMFQVKNIKIVVALLLISSLVFNSALWYGANRIKLPYALGMETEQEFYLKLEDHNAYNVFKYANENIPENSKLLLFREPRGYLSDLDYIRGDPLTQKVLDYSQIKDAGDMYRELKRLSITHILINTKVDFFGLHNPNQPPRYPEKILKLMDETLENNGKLLFSESGAYLYELK